MTQSSQRIRSPINPGGFKALVFSELESFVETGRWRWANTRKAVQDDPLSHVPRDFRETLERVFPDEYERDRWLWRSAYWLGGAIPKSALWVDEGVEFVAAELARITSDGDAPCGLPEYDATANLEGSSLHQRIAGQIKGAIERLDRLQSTIDSADPEEPGGVSILNECHRLSTAHVFLREVIDEQAELLEQRQVLVPDHIQRDHFGLTAALEKAVDEPLTRRGALELGDEVASRAASLTRLLAQVDSAFAGLGE